MRGLWGPVMAVAMVQATSSSASAAIQGEEERIEVASIAAMQVAPAHIQFRVAVVLRDAARINYYRQPCTIRGTVTASFRGDLKPGDPMDLIDQCLDDTRPPPIGGVILGFKLSRLSAPDRHIEAYLKADKSAYVTAGGAAAWLLDKPSVEPQHSVSDPHVLTGAQLAGMFVFGASVVGEMKGKTWHEVYGPLNTGIMTGHYDGKDYRGTWELKGNALCTTAAGSAENCHSIVLSHGIFSMRSEGEKSMLIEIIYRDSLIKDADPPGHLSGTVLKTLDQGFILARPGQPGISFITAPPPLPEPGTRVEVLAEPHDVYWVASRVDRR